MKDEALKLALAALEGADEIDCDMRDAITAIKQALAAPVQEVQEVQEWMKPHPKCDWSCMYHCTYGFSRFPECAAPEKGSAP